MQPNYPWLRTIHGGSCDAVRLQQILTTELQRAQIVRIVDGAPRGDPLAHWSDVGAAIAPQADLSAYGAASRWMDLGFEPNGRASARPGETAQPLHNDAASVPALAGAVGLLHCARHGAGGGRTLLVDAGAVANAARRRDDDLFERLFTVPVRFGGPAGEARVTPILRRDDGRLKIAWNDFRILPEQSDAAHLVRSEFRFLLQDMALAGDAAAVSLEAGDAVFFRADEVLHGREAPARGAHAPTVLKTYFSQPAACEIRAA
jgi:hypothetical protein